MKRHGIVLLVVVSILVLFSLLSVAMARVAGQLRSQAGASTDAASARLLARSGVEYASARLFENGNPAAIPTRENQADDWTCRDGTGVPLEALKNPSYGQGEPYVDLPANGRYDFGFDAFTDLDGNRRFDSWSGRLRGKYGFASSHFVLRVGQESSKICVNDGYLDVENRNGNVDSAGNKIPDHRDLGLRMGWSNPAVSPPLANGWGDAPSEIAFWDTYHPRGVVSRNRRLADLIDELGLILNVDTLARRNVTEIYDRARNPNLFKRALEQIVLDLIHTQEGINQVQTSDIGDRIIRSRPPGGYRSLDTLRRVVGEGDWAAIGPFLTVASPRKFRFWGSSSRLAPFSTAYIVSPVPLYTASRLGGFVATRTPIDLGAAGLPLLQAMVEGVSLGDTFGSNWDESVPSGGAKAARIVQMPEARALAQAIAARRPFASWYDFARWLNENRSLFFSGDSISVDWKVSAVETHLNPDALDAGNDLALALGGGGILPSLIPSFSWLSYDLERGTARSDGRRWVRGTRNCEQRLVRSPSDGLLVNGNLATGFWGTYPAQVLPSQEGAFRIESLGRGGAGATARQTVIQQVGHFLTAGAQSDFENLEGNQRAAQDVVQDGRPAKDRVQTWPFFPVDSCEDYTKSDDPAVREDVYCLPVTGTVRLMDYSAGLEGKEKFYLPCWERGQPYRKEGRTWARDNFMDAGPGEAIPSAFPRPPFNQDVSGDARQAFPSFPGSAGAGVTSRWSGDSPMSGSSYGTVDGLVFNRCSGFSIGALHVYRNTGLGSSGSVYDVAGTEQTGSTVSWSVLVDYQSGAADTVLSANMVSLRRVTAPEAHRLALVFSEEGIRGYIDGIPDPGFTWPDDGPGVLHGPEVDSVYCDEMRLFAESQGEAPIRVRATQPRHWSPLYDGEIRGDVTPELRSRLKTVPSFTSGLYRFDRAVWVTGVGWEGFVPELIRQAAEDASASAPLRVEFLVYTQPGAEGEPLRIPCPEDQWKKGGGWSDFGKIWIAARGEEPIPKFTGFRYRVWMDASAVPGLNPETPVFDSVTIAYRRTKLRGLWDVQ